MVRVLKQIVQWKILGVMGSVLVLCLVQSGRAAPPPASAASPLFARGYTVVPSPQEVSFSGSDFRLNDDWQMTLGPGVTPSDMAVESLREDLKSRSGITLSISTSKKIIHLAIRPGSVKVGKSQDRNKQALAEQAYRLELKPDTISITANASAGLFYGVQTLLQLATPRAGKPWLPSGTITDWPDLQHREMYWDDARHLDRPDALKRALRTAAFFKINRFPLKLEGHFQYKSAPAIVEPYALSAEQLQEITDYGLRRHVELIPFLDSPSHVAFILKHPEYAHLRAFADNNYEFCVTNPETYKLLFAMYDELLAATKGIDSVYVPTDEAYYVGLADSDQCREKPRMEELGSVGKLLAEFVTKMGDYLHSKGRQVIFWGEYPLKATDIPAIPTHVISGIVYGTAFNTAFRKRGISQYIHSSAQGLEPLFPNFYALPPADRLNPPGREPEPRGTQTFNQISYTPARGEADLIGMIVAGWGDSGLHPDTFWLGYVTATAAGWHPGLPDPKEIENSFYRLYYGPSAFRMGRVYQLMSWQAQFWDQSWEMVASSSRKPIWGSSRRIFKPRRPAWDHAIPLPPTPSGPYLALTGDWAKENEDRLRLTEKFLRQNDELLDLLHENLQSVEHNRYSVEVLLSIARLCRQNLQFIQNLNRINSLLQASAQTVREGQPDAVVAPLDQALDLAEEMRIERNRALAQLTETWEKTWFPHVPEANGRKFRHEHDDVKDPIGNRTIDLSYNIQRQLILPFGEWVDEVRAARNKFAQKHNLPIRKDQFNWKDTKLKAE